MYFCPSRREPTTQDLPGEHSGALGDYACSSGTALLPSLYFDHPTATGAFLVGQSGVMNPETEVVTGWRATMTFARIRDGLSNTIFIGEKHVPDAWFGDNTRGDGMVYDGVNPPFSYARLAGPGFPLAKPTDLGASGPFRFGSAHSGICQFALGDGSVRAIQVSIAEDTLYRLANRADGLVVPDF